MISSSTPIPPKLFLEKNRGRCFSIRAIFLSLLTTKLIFSIIVEILINSLVDMLKNIFISVELHKELKRYALEHNTSVKKVAENAISNLISQKAAKAEYLSIKKEDISKGITVDKDKAFINARGELDPDNYV